MSFHNPSTIIDMPFKTKDDRQRTNSSYNHHNHPTENSYIKIIHTDQRRWSLFFRINSLYVINIEGIYHIIKVSSRPLMCKNLFKNEYLFKKAGLVAYAHMNNNIKRVSLTFANTHNMDIQIRNVWKNSYMRKKHCRSSNSTPCIHTHTHSK